MRPLHSPTDEPTTFPDHLPQADGRLSGRKLALVAGLLGAALVVLVGWRLLAKEARREVLQPAPLPAESEVMTPNASSGEASLKLPQSYAGWDRRPPEPLPPIPEAQRVSTASATPAPEPPLVSQVPVAPPATASGQAQPPGTPPPAAGARAPAPAPKEPKPPSRFVFAPVDKVGKSPFPTSDSPAPDGIPQAGGEPRGSGPGGMQAGQLITRAQWEIPKDVTRLWYRSQGVHAVTTTDMVSDLPGLVILRVQQPLEDKFLQGRVLIPQHSLIVATQAGQPQFGQSRVSVVLNQVELPDGAILGLAAKVSDNGGAQGLHGSTDFHTGRIVAASVLSAILSIGSRLPAGNQEGFAPTIGQDVSRDISGSISQTGKQIVGKEIALAPTVTVPAGTTVLIYPDQNITLSRPPTVIK